MLTLRIMIVVEFVIIYQASFFTVGFWLAICFLFFR